MTTPAQLPAVIGSYLTAHAAGDADAWLLFDFHGVNPIAAGLLRLEGMVTRRVFAYVPAEGTPVAVGGADFAASTLAAGVTAFLLDRDTPGLTIGPPIDPPNWCCVGARVASIPSGRRSWMRSV